MNRLKLKGGVITPFYQAVVEVDYDPEAESLLIFDRQIGKFNMERSLSGAGIVKVIVPFRYSTLNDLIVGLIDNDRTYASKFVGGVQPQVIDGSIVSI